MATEFRKLCDVEQIEAASDNATVIVEDGGDIKRIAKRNLGGASSWDDLTDKPFYSELGENIISNEVSPSGESSSSVIDMELVKAIHEYPENVVITKNTVNGPKVYKLGEITSENSYSITWSVPDPYGEGWTNNKAGSLTIIPSTGRVETGYNALDDNYLTISVTVPVKVVKPLDYEFMPDGYPKAEVKEIVRSVRLNASGAASARGTDATIAKLVYNNPESVTVYHSGNPCKFLGTRPSGNDTAFLYGIDNSEVVSLYVNLSSGDLTANFNAYVNFVDVEVPDTEETVEKLDPKFVTTIFYHGNDEYLYKDEACTQKVTFDELDAVKTTPIVISTYDEYENTHFFVTAVRMAVDQGVGQVVYVIPEDAGWLGGSRSLYTEEYEGNIGPM